jgi:predicted restriction endonuclease
LAVCGDDERDAVNLDDYLEKLASLKVDRSSGHPKPHKICLLLAVIDLIEQGIITANRIVLDDALQNAFSAQFAKLKQGNDQDDISKPFYHLKSEGFWHFHYLPGGEIHLKAHKAPSKTKLKNLIDYVSLDPALFQAFSHKTHRGQCQDALFENLEDLSEPFYRWLQATGRSEKTAKNYLQAIRGSISNWAQDEGITKRNLVAVTGYSGFHAIADQIATYKTFQSFNQRGKGMYSAALNCYREFLRDTGQVQVNEDIAHIISNPQLNETQKTQLVQTRIGQRKYREKLINYWGGCAIIGYKTTSLLIASHIKPWRAAKDEERLNYFNGLLLLPSLDKAFDLGYITFADTGRIRLSEQL